MHVEVTIMEGEPPFPPMSETCYLPKFGSCKHTWMLALSVLRTHCTKERKEGVDGGCGIPTVQDQVPHLFPNRVSGSDTLNCTFRSRQDNKPYDMWFLLQFKKIPKHVSCESAFIKTTINILDTLKGCF